MTRAGLAVSLAGAIRPVLGPLNRKLASHNARAVSRDEWQELDEMLHQDNDISLIPGMRCAACGGYLNTEADGEFTCLNCARSATPRLELEQLVENLARRLIEYRTRQD